MPRLFKAHRKKLENKSVLVSNSIIMRLHVLDRLSSEGINPTLPFLKGLSSSEFETIIETLIKKNIYVGRIFSDAVEFLSIWLVKSPHTLIVRLKQAGLKEFFYNTEYDKDGYEWPFSKLLQVFLPVIEKEGLSPHRIMNYLFNNFCFLSMPKVFIWEVIGYDQLERRLEEIPQLFHEPLLKKMAHLYYCGNNLGPHSHSLIRLYKSEKESWQEQSEGLIRVGKFLNNPQQEKTFALPTLSFIH
jgi:hypothetical protein